MDQLRIDPTLVFASAVGEGHGIARADMDALGARAAGKVRPAGGVERGDAEKSARLGHVLDFVASAHGRFRAVVVLADPPEAALVRAIHTALVSPYADLSTAMLPRLLVFDEADPDVVGEFLDVFDASECLFVVAARDGDAPAPLAPFRIVREEMRRKLGDEAHKDHVVFACEPASGELREIARAEGYVTFADGHAAPRGRAAEECEWLGTSALLPCALVGVDVKGIVAGASAMEEACTGADWEANPALLLACAHELFARARRRPVACAYGRRLRDLAVHLAAIGSGGEACRPADLDTRRATWSETWVSLIAVDEADHKLDVPSASVSTKLALTSLNELFAAEHGRMRQQLASGGCPNLTIHFPSVNAHAVGQFLALARAADELRAGLSGVR
jgi:glucose-6-phosphate isomerase